MIFIEDIEKKKPDEPTKPTEPILPYQFGSGQNKNRYAEELMFIDPARIFNMYERMNENQIKGQKNLLHLHLDWMIAQSHKMEPTAICPHCQENPVKYFRVEWYYPDNRKLDHVACETCKNILKYSPEEDKIRKINFETIARFNNPQNSGAYQNALDILFWAYGLKTGVTAQKLFELFKRAGTAPSE